MLANFKEHLTKWLNLIIGEFDSPQLFLDMTVKEGSLGAPIRHPVDWENPNFTDEKLLDDELRRVFDICHGCRRCFNLCESFPKLLI